MNIQLNPVRSIKARTNESTAWDGGTYVHAELAVVDSLTDRDYTTSVGVAFRKDEMSRDAKKARQELLDAARKGTDEFNRVQATQICGSKEEAQRVTERLEELATA